MASIGSSILPASGLLKAQFVMNFAITLANTEYMLTVPIGTKYFRMQNRGSGYVNIADTVLSSGTTYFRLHQGDSHEVGNIGGSDSIIMYVQSNKPAQTLEIIYWT